MFYEFFFFNDAATTEIYTVSDTLSLHDALPIYLGHHAADRGGDLGVDLVGRDRSEEHTSELQSPDTISYAVFCLKKKNRMRHGRRCSWWHKHRDARRLCGECVFFFNDAASPDIYTVSDTLSLHDALPISTPTAIPISSTTVFALASTGNSWLS